MSERPSRIPVEPLSERRWQEVRRNVMAQAALIGPTSVPEPRGRGRIVASVVALAAAAMFVVWNVAPSTPPVTSAAALSRFVTDASSATASAGDATLALAAHTSVLVLDRSEDRSGDAWLVSLEYGSAHFDVPPRAGRPPFTVEAGRTRVEVVGTAFTVTRDPGATSARVEVDHGAVHVVDGDTDVLLHDGEAWPVPEEPAAITASAAPEVAAEPVVVREHSAPSARDRYRQAESLESRDPAAALALYEVLSRDGGAWSAPALMSQARLEAELGHDARARTLAERYLAAYPLGINAEDARALLHRTH